jgi:hypothetical protein
MRTLKRLILFVAIVALPNIASLAFHTYPQEHQLRDNYLRPTYLDPWPGSGIYLGVLGPYVFVARDPAQAIREQQSYFGIGHQPYPTSEFAQPSYFPKDVPSFRPAEVVAFTQAPPPAPDKPMPKTEPVSVPQPKDVKTSGKTWSNVVQTKAKAPCKTEQKTTTKFRKILPKDFNKGRIILQRSLAAPSRAVFQLPVKEIIKLQDDDLFRQLFDDQLPEEVRYGNGWMNVHMEFYDGENFFAILAMLDTGYLEKLSLHGEWVTDEFLFRLSSFNEKIFFKYIDISYCPAVTDEGLKSISGDLSNVSFLSFSFCPQVSDQILQELKIPKIKYLEFENCNISDVGLIKLTPYLAKLSTLKINGCRRITDKSFATLGPVLKKNLNNLHIKGCQVSEAGLKDIEWEKLREFEPPFEQ